MGVVYEAEDLRLDRRAALKFLPQHLAADHTARTRFKHEAQAASALDHPNIGTIYEIDESSDGHMFIAMACYDGDTLKQRVDDGPVPVGEAIDIVSQVASGLSRAHDSGIVHRDIKPANVMLTRDGGVKILDFGLAKLIGHTKVTRSGVTVGTVSYMSPEQARGDEVDHRSDIFSLGAVLYELLTGKRPFPGEHDAAVLYGVMNKDPVPLSDHVRNVPPALQRIVDKAMNKDVGERYQSVGELEDDLIEVAKELGLSQTVVRYTRRRQKEKRFGLTPRQRLWAGAAVFVLAVVVSIAIRLDRAGPRTDELALAVVDFRDLAAPDDPAMSAGLTNLIHVGLVENCPIRVVSPTYLYDLRRRLFGSGRGGIAEDQSLELAKRSGATLLLAGQIVALGDDRYVTWHLVEVSSGRSLGAHRVEERNPGALADQIVADVLQLIGRETGVAEASPPVPVGNLTTASQEAYRHYVAAMLASEQGRRNDLIRELESAVELDSTFALAHFELARAHYSAGGFHDLAGARPWADRAWALRGRLSVKDRMRVEAYHAFVEFRIKDAKATYYEMLEHWPDDREVLRDSAALLDFAWYSNEAERVLERALTLYPDDPQLLEVNRNVLLNMGRREEYLAACLDELKLEPLSPDAWNDVGSAYLHAGMPDSAEVSFRRALALAPDFLQARTGFFYCDAARGDIHAAINRAEGILAQEDLLPAERNELIAQFAWQPSLSLIYFSSGRFAKALDVADTDGGQSGSVWYHRGWLMLRMGRAGDVLRYARSRPPGSLGPMNLEARALVAMDSLEAARRLVETLYASEATMSRPAVFIARKVEVEIALAGNRPERALEILDAMLREGMGTRGFYHVESMEARARAHRMAGQDGEAARVLEQLLRVDGYHAFAYYDLAVIYEALGRTEDAGRALSQFLDMWSGADEGLPQLEDARERLAAMAHTP